MSNLVFKDSTGSLVAPEVDDDGNIVISIVALKTPNGDSVIDDTTDSVKVVNPDGSNIGGISAEYNDTQPTYTDGQEATLQTDNRGNLRTREQYSPVAEDNTAGVLSNLQKPVNSSTYSPSNFKDSGSVTKDSVKASAGNVYSLRVTNENAAVRYFQLHNKASDPSAAETAVRYWVIPAGSGTAPGILQLDSSYFAPSYHMTTGIAWAISTTATTFTDSATVGEHEYDINYV